MQAKDVMTREVVTALPDTTIREIAKLLVERRISAVPVVDQDGRVLGIVSEGDLMRRPETGTDRHSSWWLSLLASPEERAIDYVKSHGGNAADVMTHDVISVSEEASLEEVQNCWKSTASNGCRCFGTTSCGASLVVRIFCMD